MPDPALDGSTIALAAATFVLAGIATWQVWLSRRAMQQQIDITDRDFRFESVRQTLAAAPMIVVEFGEQRLHRDANNRVVAADPRCIVLANRGTGPALTVRFSLLINGSTITAAQTAVPPLAQNGTFETNIPVVPDGQRPFHVDQMLVRYEDAFENTYASEYEHIWDNGGWMVWKRPWVGKEFGFQRPEFCSEDDATWGSTGREQYEWHGKMQR